MQQKPFWNFCGSVEIMCGSELVREGKELGTREEKKKAKQLSFIISYILSPLVGDLCTLSHVALTKPIGIIAIPILWMGKLGFSSLSTIKLSSQY